MFIKESYERTNGKWHKTKQPQPFTKIIVKKENIGVAAVYEPHPFKPSVLKEAVESNGHTCGKIDNGIDENSWCWVYYDWCGNPIGLSDTQPEGEVVDKFTTENLGDQNLADYLNIDIKE